MPYKESIDQRIKAALDRGSSDTLAARRIFSFDSSPVLDSCRDDWFDICQAVADKFSVPLRRIYLSGSAQTGYSYFKATEFTPGESDLDLAVVDPGLFQRFCEISYRATSGYTDQTKFGSVDDYRRFRNLVAKGFFNPYLMPHCTEKQDWFEFFNRLGSPHVSTFRSINCAVYFSETFFEGKQVDVIREYQKGSA